MLWFTEMAKPFAEAAEEAMGQLPWGGLQQVQLGLWKKPWMPRPMEVRWSKNNPHARDRFLSQISPLATFAAQKFKELWPGISHFGEVICDQARENGYFCAAPPFTTMTLNKGLAEGGLPHHHPDNARECMQMLFYFGTFEGGGLLLPDFNATLPVCSGDCVCFYGEQVRHGVEAFTGTCRYSIIF